MIDEFTIKVLPSVLILLISDQISNYPLCCSYKYTWWSCRFTG